MQNPSFNLFAMRRDKLSVRDVLILWLIDGPLKQRTNSDIAAYLEVSRQTMNAEFRDLKDRGYIQLDTIPSGSKERPYLVTEKGKRWLQAHHAS